MDSGRRAKPGQSPGMKKGRHYCLPFFIANTFIQQKDISTVDFMLLFYYSFLKLYKMTLEERLPVTLDRV